MSISENRRDRSLINITHFDHNPSSLVTHKQTIDWGVDPVSPNSEQSQIGSYYNYLTLHRSYVIIAVSV